MINYKDSQGRQLVLSVATLRFKPLFRKEVEIPCLKIETVAGWAKFNFKELALTNENAAAIESNVGGVFLTHMPVVGKDTHFWELVQGRVPLDSWVLSFMGLETGQIQAVFSEGEYRDFLNLVQGLNSFGGSS